MLPRSPHRSARTAPEKSASMSKQVGGGTRQVIQRGPGWRRHRRRRLLYEPAAGSRDLSSKFLSWLAYAPPRAPRRRHFRGYCLPAPALPHFEGLERPITPSVSAASFQVTSFGRGWRAQKGFQHARRPPDTTLIQLKLIQLRNCVSSNYPLDKV